MERKLGQGGRFIWEERLRWEGRLKKGERLT